MAQRSGARGRDIIERWQALAEQRLDYLTELFESGRWRRYHSELSLLENIREAKAAVAVWRKLAMQEAGIDNRPIDLSWLDRSTPLPLRRGAQPQDAVDGRERAASLSFARAGVKPAPVADQPARPPDSPQAAAVPASISETPVEAGGTTALAALQERYPQLRNAFPHLAR